MTYCVPSADHCRWWPPLDIGERVLSYGDVVALSDRLWGRRQYQQGTDRERIRQRERDRYHSPEGQAKRRQWREKYKDHKRAYHNDYYQRPEVKERVAEYRREYQKRLVYAAGMTFNRMKDPPELIAVAERIKETKSLLRNQEDSTK